MATFIVESSQTSRFTYEIDAATVDEAMRKAESEDCEPKEENHGPEEINHTYERRVLETPKETK